MREKILIGTLAMLLGGIAGDSWQTDPAAHSVQFITVDKNVKLEVLDWGGSGRPLVLLTGMGNNAHVYDKFAPKLTGTNHPAPPDPGAG